MIFYPSFKQDAQQLQSSFEDIPDAALQLLGGSSDFFSPIGYTNSQVYFIMLPLLLGIVSIGLGSNILIKEENDFTIESLLARPISRSKLLFSKTLAGVTILTIISAVTLVSIIAVARIVNLEVSVSALSLGVAVCYMLCLSFGAITFAISSSGISKGIGLGIATLVAFGGYIISSLSGTVTWLATPAKIFPFHYYDSEAILRGNYNWDNIWYFVAVIVICMFISWISFSRRDLS
jgi:ABC-2 type transport system permease protein